MKQYEKFTSDIIIFVIATAFIALQNAILVPILTKNLGASLYGVWSQITVTVMVLSTVASLGLRNSIIRFLAAEKNKNKISRIFFSVTFFVAISGILFSIVMFLLSDFLAITIVKDITSSFFIQFASVLVLITVLNHLMLGFFETFRQTKNYSLFIIFQNILEIGLIFYLVASGYGLFGAILASVLIKALVFLIGLVIIIKQVRFSFPGLNNMKEYLGFGFPLILVSFFTFVIHSGDVYIIGYFKNAFNIGVYSAVYSLSKVVMLFMTPISFVLFAAVSKAWDNKRFDEVKSYLSYSFKYFLFFSIPAAFGLSFLAVPILKIFSTNEFLSGWFLFPFIAFGLVIYKLAMIFANILTAKKKTALIGAVYVIAALFNIGLNIILIPLIGLIGAAIATLVTYFLVTLVFYLVSLKYLRFNLNIWFVIKSIIASIIMVFAVRLFSVTNIGSLLLVMVFGAFVYTILILLFKGISKEEKEFFKKYFKGKLMSFFPYFFEE